MNDKFSEPEPETTIVEIERAFEQQWQDNERPNIDSYLGCIDLEDRDELLEKLVTVEVEQKIREKEFVDAAAYRKYGNRAEEIARKLIAVTLPSPQPQSQSVERKTIGRYRLLQKIGEGGMGTVFMADQVEPIRRRVAVKIIKVRNHKDTDNIIARFEAERQALAVMSHENVCQILDAGAEDGVPYFVMELVNGIPITEYCDQKKLSIPERLNLFRKVCSAVQHAHQKGIIHRDLKPSNILVAPHDGQPVPKVIDFGLAKTLESENWLTDKTMFTEFGQVVGTALYMSPEQAELNQLDVDTRSDIYSLGVILYELLTGSPPRGGISMGRELTLDVLKKIQENEPIRPSVQFSTNANADLTVPNNRSVNHSFKLQQMFRGELDWIVMKALEKDRFRRYETVDAFEKDVERYLNGEPVLAGRPSRLYQLRKFASKHWRAMTAGLAVLVTLVCLIVFSIYWAQKEKFNQIQLQQANARASRADYKSAIYFLSRNKIEQFTENLLKVPKDYRFIEWRLANRQVSSDRVLRKHEGVIHAVAISPSGTTLATAGDDRKILLWDLESWSVKRIIDSPHGVESIFSLAFHPNRELLISGGGDNQIKFWDLTTDSQKSGPQNTEPEKTELENKKFSSLRLKGSVRSIAISSDGKRLAAGGGKDINLPRVHQDEFVTVWDFDNLTQPREFSGFQRRVTKVAFNNSGSKILAAGCDLKIHLWDVESGDEEKTWRLSSYVWDFEVSRDDNSIIACTEDDYIYLLDSTESGKVIWKRDGHLKGTAIYSLQVSSDGQVLASGSVDGSIKVWNPNTGESISLLTGHTEPVYDLAFTHGNSILVSVGSDSSVRAWDLTKGPESMSLANHHESVNAVDFSGDSKLLISGSGFYGNQPYGQSQTIDNSVRVWDLSTGENIETHELNIGPISDVVFDPGNHDGQVFAASSGNGTIQVVNRQSQEVLFERLAHKGGVNRICFDSTGRRIASVGNDGMLCIWNIADTSLLYRFKDQSGSPLFSIDWAVDDRWMVVGSGQGRITMIDVESQQVQWSISNRSGEARAIAICPKLEKIFVGQSSLMVLNFAGEKLGVHANHNFSTYAIDLFEENHSVRMLSGSHNGSWKLWDAEDMDELRSIVPYSKRRWNHVFDVQISPDGQKIAIANSDNRIQIWDCTRE